MDWNFSDYNHSTLNSIHPYPAKFIPNIPGCLIKVLGVPDSCIVFDPFCGCGTTLIEAQRQNIPFLGVDLNPIACLISKVSTGILPRNASRDYEKLIACIKEIKPVKNPSIPRVDHWFKPSINSEINRIVLGINQSSSGFSRDIFKLALSSIIVKVSNQDSDTRYAAIEKYIQPKDVIGLFNESYIKICDALRAKGDGAVCGKIVCEDILKVTPSHFDKPVGLVITSPPYPNAYEYWLYHKYRMWWLGYDPERVKELEIGARPHYFKKNGHTAEDFFKQMSKVFQLLNTVVVKDGHVAIVIGRSIIHGQTIDNNSLVERAADAFGFRKVWNVERLINPYKKSFNLSHAKIKTEHIILFRK